LPRAYLYFKTLLPTLLTPAVEEVATFVVAWVLAAAFLAFLATHLLMGSVDIFAKPGANQRLKPSLNGSSAFVIAYAVATLVSLSASSVHLQILEQQLTQPATSHHLHP
jgi:hypothetical protein